MSGFANIINNQMQNLASFFNISQSYFKKRNPIADTINSTLSSLNFFLTLNKRAKMMKNQVQYMYYRMHQMEKLINDSNPHNALGGKSFNRLR